MLNVERNKAFHISLIPTPNSQEVEPYYSDELRRIWQTSIRDWSVYSKKEELVFD
jgi:hypothetical protein